MIQIIHRYTSAVLFESATSTTVKTALIEAVGEGANLRGANLEGANLKDAYLRGAYLEGANLEPIRKDLFDVLAYATKEVPALLEALRVGKVDGSTYEGECACLVGTIANVRECDYNEVSGLKPNASRPAERWFLAIREGDTPKTNPIVKITEGWIIQWMASNASQEA